METVQSLPHEKREQISTGLEKLLADTYTVYLMSHNFHWNVTGPQFYSYHTMFEEHYTALALAVDEIAERIRTLGFPAPATYKEFGDLTSIKEPEGVPLAKEMIKILVNAHNSIITSAHNALKQAEDFNDPVTVDLINQRLSYHEKIVWMLKSHLM